MYFITGGSILNTWSNGMWTNCVQGVPVKIVSNFTENENQLFPARISVEPTVWVR